MCLRICVCDPSTDHVPLKPEFCDICDVYDRCPDIQPPLDENGHWRAANYVTAMSSKAPGCEVDRRQPQCHVHLPRRLPEFEATAVHPSSPANIELYQAKGHALLLYQYR